MAVVLPNGKNQFFATDGTPLVGGLVYTYVAGTSTPKDTYTTHAAAVANTNPVVLNSRGEAAIYWDGVYDIVLKDSNGSTLWGPERLETPEPAGSAAALRADLANAADVLEGAALSGFSQTLNYASGTVGWGIRSAGTAYNILRDIPVSEWAAVLAGTSTVDHSTILQARIDAMAASIGGTILIPGQITCNTPILLKERVCLQGLDRRTSKIRKDSTTTKAVTITAGAMVVYVPGTLSATINCIIALDGNVGRYNGRIADLTLEGTLSTPGDYETPKVEFGIVSLGSVSESAFERVTIVSCTYAMVFPSIFASYINRVTWEYCLKGLSIDNGTSCNITSCYANYGRDWGYFLRDLKYTLVAGNACDSLNDPVKYPTSRARECSAYRLRSAVGMVVTGNGDEQTYGNSYYLETFNGSVMSGNVSIGIGSDYTGAEQIAWIKSDNAMDGSDISDNHAYNVKGTGLTSGGASAGAHHNIYAPTPTSCLPRRFDNNVVAAARTSLTTEAGWGNNSLHPESQPTTVTAATYSTLATETAVIANRAGTVTLTLLAASSQRGKEITVRTIQAQAVVSASSDVVPLAGGAAGTAILAATAGKWATLKSDGTNWQIMAAA